MEALDEALTELAAEDELAAKVVELRYFAGLGHEQIAEFTGVSVYEARKKWTYARAWLREKLSPNRDDRMKSVSTVLIRHVALVGRPVSPDFGIAWIELQKWRFEPMLPALNLPRRSRTCPATHNESRPSSSTPCRNRSPSGRSFSSRECGGDSELRRRVDALIAAHDQSGSFLDSPPKDLAGTSPTIAHVNAGAGRQLDRPVQAAAADRRRGHGLGLHGRADRAGRATRRSENHQAGDGHQSGDRPFRGRAASTGDDGSSEHRQSAGCRNDQLRSSLLCDGTGSRRSDHAVLRRTSADAATAIGVVLAGLPGRSARPSEGNHSPRHQAVERAGRRV